MNREILPSMMERNSGHIVALSSLSSMAGVPGISAYTATKYATNGKSFNIISSCHNVYFTFCRFSCFGFYVNLTKNHEKFNILFSEFFSKKNLKKTSVYELYT